MHHPPAASVDLAAGMALLVAEVAEVAAAGMVAEAAGMGLVVVGADWLVLVVAAAV